MITLDFFPELTGVWRVVVALVLVLVGVAISYWQRIDLERELLVASARAFVQLIAIGYVLELVFGRKNPLWVVVILLVMCVAAARTAGRRGKGIPAADLISFLAIDSGTAFTLTTLVGLRIFTFDAQTMIPIGGMTLGASLTIAALTLNRLKDDFHSDRQLIEEALALGATNAQAAQPIYKRALRAAMIPIIDQTRSVGLVKLPGAMTGLILAGVSPLEAVQIQLVVMYMLVSASTITGLVCALLGYRRFFTNTQQLDYAVVSLDR